MVRAYHSAPFTCRRCALQAASRRVFALVVSRSFLIVCDDAVCHPAFLNKRRYDNSASAKGPEGHNGVGATCNATAKAEFELLFLEIKSITCFLNFLTSNKITSPMTCIEPRGI